VIINPIPAGTPKVSVPSPRYSRDICTHSRGFRGIPAVPIPVQTSTPVAPVFISFLFCIPPCTNHTKMNDDDDDDDVMIVAVVVAVVVMMAVVVVVGALIL